MMKGLRRPRIDKRALLESRQGYSQQLLKMKRRKKTIPNRQSLINLGQSQSLSKKDCSPHGP